MYPYRASSSSFLSAAESIMRSGSILQPLIPHLLQPSHPWAFPPIPTIRTFYLMQGYFRKYQNYGMPNNFQPEVCPNSQQYKRMASDTHSSVIHKPSILYTWLSWHTQTHALNIWMKLRGWKHDVYAIQTLFIYLTARRSRHNPPSTIIWIIT